MNKFFESLMEQWYIIVYFLFGNGVTIWVGLTLTNRISKTFQVWYPIMYLFGRISRKGYFLDIVGSIPGQSTRRKYLRRNLERFLYISNGFYKNLEATSGIPGTIGFPNQFKNGLIIDSPDLAYLIRSLITFNKYGALQRKALDVYDFWESHLQMEDVPTKTIWVFQISLITYLGGRLKTNLRKEAYDEICRIFLSDMIVNGNVKLSDLEKISIAATFLTPQQKQEEFLIFALDLINETSLNITRVDSGPALDFIREINHKWNESSRF